MQLPQSAILVIRIIQFFPKFNSSCYIQVKLLYSIVMIFACRYCDSVLSTRGNRSRQETKFHPDEMKLPTYHCSLCEFTSRKMSELEQHMRTQHSRFTNCCRSCQLGFNSSHLYAQHARSVLSIPVFGAEFQPNQPPDQSAFNGSLQSYSREPTDDEMVLARDLQAFMKIKQKRIQELIDQKLSAGPQKVQFSAELQLLKHFREPDEDDERLTIFANSLMTPVYAEGLSNADFSSMVEKMLAVLFTFASSGSGWLLEKVLRVNIKFAKYRPASGSSYVDLS